MVLSASRSFVNTIARACNGLICEASRGFANPTLAVVVAELCCDCCCVCFRAHDIFFRAHDILAHIYIYITSE